MKMDYFKAFDKIKTSLENSEISLKDEHLAIQVILTDEDCGGILYIENNFKNLVIMPYNYYDHDLNVIADYKSFMELITAKKSLGALLEKITIRGDMEVAKDFFESIKPIKKTAAKKTTAKKTTKTAEKKESAPAKKATKKATEKADAPKAEAKKVTKKATTKKTAEKVETPKAEVKKVATKAEAKKVAEKVDAPKAEAPKTTKKAEAPKTAVKTDAPKASEPAKKETK